ncbi:MAG: FecR domain-containing protein [Deltaproteobacteria bacterium]|nr:FecR domain-containing protein [Deltaproteobacteria bacterium]
MMRKSISIVTTMVVMFLVCTGSAHAQMTDIQGKTRLLGMIFKLENLEERAATDIQRYESRIKKCGDTIRKCQNIINLAQEKGHTQAEKVAGDALAKAMNAKRINTDLKNAAELRKKRAAIAIATVSELLKTDVSARPEIKSLITDYSGDVYVWSEKQGKTIKLGEDSVLCLKPGEVILTKGNSRVEVQFLDGRGAVRIGEHSRLSIEENESGSQTINMIKGKIHIAVNKLDEHRKMFEEKLKSYKDLENPSTVKDVLMQEIAEEYEEKKDRIEKVKSGKYDSYGFLGPLGSAPLIRTSGFSGAVRGTKFLVFEDEKRGSELIVLEGVVDVKAIKGEKIFPVDAGYRIQASKDGVISKPEMIDPTKTETWWEK